MDDLLAEHDFLAGLRGELDQLLSSGTTSRQELARRFGYSRDKLNRRLRDANFSAYELALLRDWYGVNVSPRPPAVRPRYASFRLPPTDAAAATFSGVTYLRGVAAYMDGLLAGASAAGAASPTIHMELASSDVNFLSCLGQPTLALYKAYLYEEESTGLRTHFATGGSVDEASAAMIAAAARAYEAYTTIDSAEVWGRTPFTSTFEQLGALVDRHRIGAVAIGRIGEGLHALVAEISESLRRGRKPNGGTLHLYENGNHAMSPMSITRAGDRRVVTTVVANPAYISSEESDTYDYFATQLARRRKRSRIVGGPGLPTDRSWAARLHAQIDDGIQAVTAHIEHAR